MAFFQVLPKETGFAEKFGEGFGQAFGGTIQERLGKFFEEKDQLSKAKKLQSTLENLPEKATYLEKLQAIQPYASPEVLSAYGTMATQEQKEKLKTQGIRDLLQAYGVELPGAERPSAEPAEPGQTPRTRPMGEPKAKRIPTDEEIYVASLTSPQLAQQLRATRDAHFKEQQTEAEALGTREAYAAAGLKMPDHKPGTPAKVYHQLAGKKIDPSQVKQEEKEAKGKTLKDIVEKLRDKIKFTGSTKIPGTASFGGKSFNRQAVQERAYFNTLAFMLEGFFRDMATKGQLPKAIFDTLMSKLPSADLSERENIGRLDAIEDILPGYFPELQGEGTEPKEPEVEEIYIEMIDPAGKRRSVPQHQVEDALKWKYKRVE